MNTLTKTAFVEFIDSHQTVLSNLVRLLVRSASGDGKVMTSTKDWESAKEKMARKGYKSFLEFPDIFRAAILCRKISPETVVRRLARLTHHYGAVIAKLEVKQGSSDNPYKGATHLDLLWEGGLKTEVIVTTTTLWAYKEEAHKCYKGGQPNGAKALFNVAVFRANSREFRTSLWRNAAKVKAVCHKGEI